MNNYDRISQLLGSEAEYLLGQEALDILPQYIDGSITMEMYIKEIEGRLNLIRTENQTICNAPRDL